MTEKEVPIQPHLRGEEGWAWVAVVSHLQIDLTGVDALLREEQ